MVESALQTSKDKFQQMLGSFSIIDIGVIQSVYEGRAHVVSYRHQADQVMEYDDVEVIYPGNIQGAFYSEPEGAMCLLICPRTIVDDLSTPGAATVNGTYSSRGMKAMPISNAQQSDVSVGFNGDGSFHIITEKYILTFDKLYIQLVVNEGAFSAVANFDGSLEFTFASGLYRVYYGPDGMKEQLYLDSDNKPVRYEKIQPDGTCTVYHAGYESLTDEQYGDMSSYNSWHWIETYTQDGTKTVIHNDENGDELNNVTISDDGSVDIVSTKATISIGADGSISITTEGDINIETDGATNIKSTGDINLESSGNTTIKSTGTTEIKGGQVKLAGTVTPSGSGALCGMPYCAYTGAPQAGSISMNA